MAYGENLKIMNEFDEGELFELANAQLNLPSSLAQKILDSDHGESSLSEKQKDIVAKALDKAVRCERCASLAGFDDESFCAKCANNE